MRGPRFLRRMSQLALVAMLLLLALPTAGRMATAIAADAAGAEGRWIELCTVAGRTTAFIDAQGRIAHRGDGPLRLDDPPPPPPHDPHDDGAAAPECDYCPLLAGLALHWPRLAPAISRSVPVLRRPADATPPQPALLPGGPGSRGPPHALRTA